MNYKQTTASHNTITRDMSQIAGKVGNVYEAVAIISKRSNEISVELKKELDSKLQEFAIPQDNIEELFENREQIEISKSYERMPKPTLIATQEFLDDQIIYRNASKDQALEK